MKKRNKGNRPAPASKAQPAAPRKSASTAVYKPLARALHWIMAVLVIFQAAGGLFMTFERPDSSYWAKLSDGLWIYDSHKVLGIVLLLLVLFRFANRMTSGAPADDPKLKVWQREASHMVHAWLYLLLFVVPLLGWVGISLYPALVVYGGVPLPGLTSPNQAASAAVFIAHKYSAFLLIALIAMHIGAALFHHFIERDGTLRRMLPSLKGPQT